LRVDRGYDFPVIAERLAAHGLNELGVQKRGIKPTCPLGPEGF
jgi:hypothetical protein